jgi:hypothetical protein
VIDLIMRRAVHLSRMLQDADHSVESAGLRAFQIIKQLYECTTPEGTRHRRPFSQFDVGTGIQYSFSDAKHMLEARAEFSLDLPPPPVVVDWQNIIIMCIVEH